MQVIKALWEVTVSQIANLKVIGLLNLGGAPKISGEEQDLLMVL